MITYDKVDEYKDKMNNPEDLSKYLSKLDKTRNWFPIPNFDKYLASDQGEILTIKTANFTKGVTAGHYLKVSLFKNGNDVSKMEYVHILVCRAKYKAKGKKWPKGKNIVVKHLDDNKMNNKMDNHEADTQSNNIKEAYANGLISKEDLSMYTDW